MRTAAMLTAPVAFVLSSKSGIQYPNLFVGCGAMKASKKVEVKSMDGLVKTIGTVLFLPAAALVKPCWVYLFV